MGKVLFFTSHFTSNSIDKFFFICDKNSSICQTMTSFRNVGMLTVEAAPGEGLKEIIKSLVDAGENFQVLSSEELKKRFPELSFPPHYTAVLEHSAGILKADKCLRVLQVWRFSIDCKGHS